MKELTTILDQTVDGKKVFGTSFCVSHQGEMWCGASGNLNEESQFYIASTTKLYLTALVLYLKYANKWHLDDKIVHYLDSHIIKDLHVLNGKEHTPQITIKHLLAHTSGLPDYFQQKNKEGKSLEQSLIQGNDQYWTFEEAIALSKTLNPKFIPAARGKAYYSDTNFQLLGKMIENITQQPLYKTLDDLIFHPLVLRKTYLYQDPKDNRPKHLYYKNQPLYIPKAMAAFGADGGIVSTAREMMLFLQAFFDGTFFPKHELQALQIWNNIFFPLQSGIGIHRFRLPWYFDPFGKMPALIGHSGLSGALAFYSPSKEIFITGTVNQVAYPSTSFQLMIRLIQQMLKKKLTA